MELRVTLNCYVSITDHLEESVGRRLSAPSVSNVVITVSNAREVTERYRRLLDVVVNNWWYTDWLVRAYLARHINTTDELTLYDAGVEAEDEQDMIPLILSQLAEADADFFRDICGEQWLLVQDDPFWDCFEFGLSSIPAIEGQEQ